MSLSTKIAICSLSIGKEYKQTVKYGIESKVLYCSKHGYDFIQDESVVDNTRDLQWSKIQLLLKYLQPSVERKYDYLVWIDADTYIMNNEITIESLISKYNLANINIIYQKDPYIWVNTGFMIIKNTDWSRDFLNESYKHTDKICHEQGAIDWLWRENWNHSQTFISVLDHSCGLNQYWHTYRINDFVIHFPGSREKCMIQNALGKFMTRYCPLRMAEDSDESYQKRMAWLSGDVITFNQEEFIKATNAGKLYPLDFYC